MNIIDHPKAILGIALAVAMTVGACLDSVSFRGGKTPGGKPAGTVYATFASATPSALPASSSSPVVQ